MRKVLFLGLVLVLAGCATQPVITPSAEVPGFLHGVFHGVIAPFMMIGSFFTEYRMYAFPNTGHFYDLGFVIGFGLLVGGASS